MRKNKEHGTPAQVFFPEVLYAFREAGKGTEPANAWIFWCLDLVQEIELLEIIN